MVSLPTLNVLLRKAFIKTTQMNCAPVEKNFLDREQ